MSGQADRWRDRGAAVSLCQQVPGVEFGHRHLPMYSTLESTCLDRYDKVMRMVQVCARRLDSGSKYWVDPFKPKQ